MNSSKSCVLRFMASFIIVTLGFHALGKDFKIQPTISSFVIFFVRLKNSLIKVMNLVCISQILSFGYILKSSNFIVRVVNLETFTSHVPLWVISKIFQGRFTILNLTRPNKIKSIKKYIHSLSIMTIPFLLFIIPLIYGF